SQKYEQVPITKEFVAGETFLFLGQNYSLELVRDRQDEVRLNGGRIELSCSDRNHGRQLLQAWFLSQANKHIRPRAARLAKGIGVRFTRILVRDLRHSWGGCSAKGTLTFNWRIVQAPAIVVDYLLAHELAHLREPNHSVEFWNIVAVHAPAWQTAKEWLKYHGS